MQFADTLRLSPGDLSECRALLRDGSKSFFAASRLLPRDVRTAACAIYALCRTADDAVDGGHATLETVSDMGLQLDRVYGRGEPRDFVERSLRAVVRHYEIPRTVFSALVEGFAWELEDRKYETLSDVYAYSARVAATVGVAMTIVMGRRDAATLACACELGIAMQLTNIARDVGEDAANGRLYLPREWMREMGIDPDEWLAHPSFSPALGSVVRRLLSAADALYDRAAAGIDSLPAECRPAIRAARLIYREIGTVIARRGFDSVSHRAHTTATRKAWLALQAFVPPAPAVGRSVRHPLPEYAFLIRAAAKRRVRFTAAHARPARSALISAEPAHQESR
jgi:phytoene synthase